MLLNIWFLLFIIVLYFFFVFVVLRFLVPFLGFKKAPLPKTLPADFEQAIDELNKKSKTNEEFLHNAYDFITKKYHGARMRTLTDWEYSFKHPFSHKPGYIPCTIHNYLLRILLVKSNRFSDDDIKTQVVFFNFFIHQYLKVKINNTWVAVDPNSRYQGVAFGKHAVLFG
jgi:hypothetical protein